MCTAPIHCCPVMGASSSSPSPTCTCKSVATECQLGMSPDNHTSRISVRKAGIANSNSARIVNDYVDLWDNKATEIMWDIAFENTGPLTIALGMASDKQHAGAKIEIEVDYMRLHLVSKNTGSCNKVKVIKAGTLMLKTVGIHTIRVRAVEIRNRCAGYLHFLQLSGVAAKDVHVVEMSNRVDNVALKWDKAIACEVFYMEMSVKDTCKGATFVACGFSGGYFGVRDNEFSNRRGIVFCVHDPASRREIAENNNEPRVVSINNSRCVSVEKFGYAGTGLQSFYGYYWNTNETYRFLLLADSSSVEGHVIYSAYFYRNEIYRWKRIASFKVLNGAKQMKNLSSSIEDYMGSQGRFCRQAYFGPGWVYKPSGEWMQLVQASFAQSGNLKNTEVAADQRFYLCTGGNFKQTFPAGKWVSVNRTENLPNVLSELDLPKCKLVDKLS